MISPLQQGVPSPTGGHLCDSVIIQRQLWFFHTKSKKLSTQTGSPGTRPCRRGSAASAISSGEGVAAKPCRMRIPAGNRHLKTPLSSPETHTSCSTSGRQVFPPPPPPDTPTPWPVYHKAFGGFPFISPKNRRCTPRNPSPADTAGPFQT